MSQWQDISTAPKDGTDILVCVLPSAMFVARWQRGDGKDPYECNSGNGPGWIDGTTDNYDDYIVFEPTHWMPLPAPPSTEGLSQRAIGDEGDLP